MGALLYTLPSFSVQKELSWSRKERRRGLPKSQQLAFAFSLDVGLLAPLRPSTPIPFSVSISQRLTWRPSLDFLPKGKATSFQF